ncbi:MAG: hypothetical protein OXM55_06900 [Bdellovibrionales bacterium]|nr:hypothetical protein [Bdellovibrionales bacterium]
MMKQTVFSILFLSFLCACEPLNIDDGGDTRPDDRSGDLEEELPKDVFEGLSWQEILKNCKPEVDVPSNVLDLALDTINLSQYYLPGQIRKCLEKKLEDAHNKICAARVKLERKRDNARDGATRARVENSLVKLDTMQFKFNQRLYNMALNLDDHLQRWDRNGKAKTVVGRTWDFFKEEETEALRDILDIESYSECNTYSRDDE